VWLIAAWMMNQAGRNNDYVSVTAREQRRTLMSNVLEREKIKFAY
jgi:hypothetical protein